MKTTGHIVRRIFVLLALSLISDVTVAKDWAVSLRECKSVADCIMIDMNCGRPGAVNRAYKNYSEAPDGCDKSLNYAEEAKNNDLACLSGKCALVPKKAKIK